MRAETVRGDVLLNKLTSMSPAEINTWVTGNVNTVADVRKVLTKVLIILQAVVEDSQ